MIKLTSLLSEQATPAGLNLTITGIDLQYPSGASHPNDVPGAEQQILKALQPLKIALASGKYANMKHQLTINAVATISPLTTKMIETYWKQGRHGQKWAANAIPIGGEANAKADNEKLAYARAESLYVYIISLIQKNNWIVKDSKGTETRLIGSKLVEMLPMKINSSIGTTRSASATIKTTGDLPDDKKPVPEIRCTFNWGSDKQRRAADPPYTWKSEEMTFSADVNDSMRFRGTIAKIPDAYFVKYGDHEFFSGFNGAEYSSGMVIGSSDQTKEMKRLGYYGINWSWKWNRRFAVEIAYLMQRHNLLGHINTQITSIGGSPVTAIDVMPNYDTVIATIEQYKDIFLNWRSVKENKKAKYLREWKAGVAGGWGRTQKSTETIIKNNHDDKPVQFLAFPPLRGTIWTVKGRCVASK